MVGDIIYERHAMGCVDGQYMDPDSGASGVGLGVVLEACRRLHLALRGQRRPWGQPCLAAVPSSSVMAPLGIDLPCSHAWPCGRGPPTTGGDSTRPP